MVTSSLPVPDLASESEPLRVSVVDVVLDKIDDTRVSASLSLTIVSVPVSPVVMLPVTSDAVVRVPVLVVVSLPLETLAYVPVLSTVSFPLPAVT